MIVYEFKVKGKEAQYHAIDEAIRTSQFIQNKCLRYWMENKGLRQYDLNKYVRYWRQNFPGLANSTQWLGSLRLNELGVQSLGFTTTARRK